MIFIYRRAESVGSVSFKVLENHTPSTFLESMCSLPSAMDNRGFEILPETPEEALFLLKTYVYSFDSETPLPYFFEKYIATCFRILANAESIDRDLPAKALGLKQNRRGVPSKNKERDIKITNDVIDLMNNGESLFSASLIVSEIFGIHESNIQKIYCKHQKGVKNPDGLEYPF